MNARRLIAPINEFLDSETSGGLVLMAAAALAMIIANSPLLGAYEDALHAKLLGISVLHWINDALMAIFFLLVGLEIKREFLFGELSSWSQRILPALAAAGGMAVPALVYVALNSGPDGELAGWAVPSATDIAFALGIMALLGPRVPASLKIFLMALAIIDDLGAVVIIAAFYTHEIHLWALAASAGVTIALIALNLLGVNRLLPYLLLGAALWFFMHESGVHATIAGVVLALTIPADGGEHSPLMTLEHALAKPVAFLIVPLFGFANAGIPLAGMTLDALLHPITIGIAAGLFVGKQVGVFVATWAATALKLAERPEGANWAQIYGVSLLCGVGFTMSLFIGFLAFPEEPAMTQAVKLGVLAGSVASGVLGAALLAMSGPRAAPAGA
ncbi:MAG: Na+/H+ antiporter NhaA [Notoacmeibacter sp.]|nr:Na+/H+ antiporter NhaA [Notoacmeibacter sp.]MCC0032285.1 Na+/H+ antiporter NhaA [Brucellaceae bacterium]